MTATHREQPPAGAAARPFRFPAFARERPADGLEVVLAPRSEVPLVEILLQLPAGAERNPLDRPGLATLTASLADEGTARRSGPEIALALERLGGSLSTRADWNGATIGAGLLAEDLDAGLELVSEIARTPTFPSDEVERLRRQALAELLRRHDQASVLADEAFARALYAGTPYGYLLIGDEASLETLTREEIVSFHAACFRPAGAALLVAGQLDPDLARARIERHFGDWRAAAPPAPAPISAAGASARRVVVVDRPHAAQTELRIGHVGVPRTHPDRTKLGLLNALLGGKFTSRLNLTLRERHGYTYGASSRFVDRRSAGPFVVSTAVANEVVGAAARATLAELERLREQPVTTTELDETRSYLTGVFPYTLQSASDLLARLAELTLWGLPDDHFEGVLATIATTTSDELLELAQRHLRPEISTIVAVGPARDLEPQLAEIGAVEVLAL